MSMSVSSLVSFFPRCIGHESRSLDRSATEGWSRQQYQASPPTKTPVLEDWETKNVHDTV